MEKYLRRAKSKFELRRRPPSRQERSRVLIVTEGSKTEPRYFKRLISELMLATAKVKIVADGGSAPISVVETAEATLKYDNDFDKVYCVFDKDRHESYERALQKIAGLAARRGSLGKEILPITSVPCFEYWYMLHVCDHRRPYETAKSPADALIAELVKQKPFENYKKSDCDDFYDAISSNRTKALDRAGRFLKMSAEEGGRDFHENPSTRVFLLVNDLIELSKIK